MPIRLIPALLCLLLAACAPNRNGDAEQAQPLKYASLLQMEEADSFTLVTVADAWHRGQTLARYVLIPSGQALPTARPAGTVVRTPLKRAVVTSAVHAALLTDLGCSQRIAGLTDTAYIVSPAVKRLLHKGVRSMGTAMQPDIELIHASRADGVLVSPFENAGHGAIGRLGIPVIECADYMETSPLGRAEWMRFYGRLFGEAERADSLFARVESAYLTLREKAKLSQSHPPTVMCDLLTGATWYQPSGTSTMGSLIADAGGHYLWADRPESGSLPLNLETVFARARNADIWLVKYGQSTALTYRQMAADCPGYKQFRPWQRRHIFACNTLQVPFYEEVPFHPDRLLASLIRIFNPEIKGMPHHVYYTPLAE